MNKHTKAAFLGLALGVAAVTSASRAVAQTPEELNAARALFQEAYTDEQEKRFTEALEKFQRVAKVRESASVRYRIANVLAELGRLREARDMFRVLAASSESLDAKDKPIAESAAERALVVDKRIPRLKIKPPEEAPADLRVTVDGASVPTGRPLELDPGEHVVNATATGKKQFESRVKLAEGGETPFDVKLEAGDSSGDTTAATTEVTTDSKKTIAYVAIGGGGVLFVTGVALLIAREGTISDIEKTCPGNVCPTASQADIQDKRDQAGLFAPLGVGFSLVGLAAAGVGTYLLVKNQPASSPATATARGVRVAPAFVRGGAWLGLGATF